ncbi:hypothetical protein ACSBOB_22920 [Mesorhizobium sp. ASY16-5R]|uniref:hypothetical protein n=1 Tax=Mesorhizobium sp. ASY16-5R TaxID=3445772 RepID=UPI003F9F7DB4
MGDQKTRETRLPQADKGLSYERDCRDAYGENNKSKRKAIPKFKAASNREGRHLSKVVVDRMTGDENVDEEAGLLASDRKSLQPSKTKSPDIPLGKMLVRRHKLR